MQIKRLVSTLLVALPVLAGCRTDEKLNAPATVDPMFQRYASLGNSITAGFQSGGISDSTQLRSYAQLLAKAMGTSFNYPRLNGRGCAVFQVTRVLTPGSSPIANFDVFYASNARWRIFSYAPAGVVTGDAYNVVIDPAQTFLCSDRIYIDGFQ